MEKRHQDSLTNRLEDAWLNGVSHVTWEELYLWYDTQKIAARTYRDLQNRWWDLTDGKGASLTKIEGRGGIFVFGGDRASKVDQKSISDDL